MFGYFPPFSVFNFIIFRSGPIYFKVTNYNFVSHISPKNPLIFEINFPRATEIQTGSFEGGVKYCETQYVSIILLSDSKYLKSHVKNYVGHSWCKTFWNVDSADDELHESWLNSGEDCWKSNFEVEQGKNFPSPIYWLLIWEHIPFPKILKCENLIIFPWMEVLISSYMEHFKDWMGLLSYKSTFSFASPIKEKHVSLCESHIHFNRSRVNIMADTLWIWLP